MGIRTCVSITCVFIGCCINVIVLEKLTNSIIGVANLITFFQFVFIAVEGFLFTSRCGTRRSQVSMKDCSILVIMFFFSSVCNNYAYNFNVPTTLHIIVKSGSLLTNMAVGISLGKKYYTKQKYVSVVLVTVGIVICTLSSAKTISNSPLYNHTDILWWCFGIALLIIALVIGAFMGLLQENLFAKCGKHPKDVLYYTHLLPLPMFIFLYGDLMNALKTCIDYSPIGSPALGVLSSAWILLLINVITQYVCIRSVYILTSECTFLTVTLVLTLRKFISLLLSVILFENTFTFSHWIGTVFVFFGTLLYSDVVNVGSVTKLHPINK